MAQSRGRTQDELGIATIGDGYLCTTAGVALGLAELPPPDLALFDTTALQTWLTTYRQVLMTIPERIQLYTYTMAVDQRPWLRHLTTTQTQVPDQTSFVVLDDLCLALQQTMTRGTTQPVMRWILAVSTAQPLAPPAHWWGELDLRSLLGTTRRWPGDPVTEARTRTQRMLGTLLRLGHDPAPRLLTATEIRSLLGHALDPIGAQAHPVTIPDSAVRPLQRADPLPGTTIARGDLALARDSTAAAPTPGPDVVRPPWVAPPPPTTRTTDPAAPLVHWRWDRVRRAAPHTRQATITTDADLVAPSSVDRQPHAYVRSGQSYLRAYAVLALPRQVPPGLLGRLARVPGVQTTLVNHPVNRSVAKERMHQQLQAFGGTAQQERKRQTQPSVGTQVSDDADAKVSVDDTRQHQQALAQQTTGHHLFGLYLTVAAADLASLDAASRAVQDACDDVQVQVVRCDGAHWDGVLTTAPLGRDELAYLRETDTQTLTRLIPDSPPSTPMTTGTPLRFGTRAVPGQADPAGGAEVWIDVFGLISPLKVIIAGIGGGKTYLQSWLLAQRYAFGDCAICVIDPKDQEYRMLIDDLLGGTYVVLSEHSAVRFNPFMLPVGTPTELAALRATGQDLRADRASFLKQVIATEARLRGLPLSGRAEALLEEAILACYDQRGITHDPTTFHTDVPIFSDVVAWLTHQQADPALLDHLALFTSGILGRLFNTPSAVPLAIPPSRHRADVGVLGIDLSPIVRRNDETLSRIVPVLLSNLCISVGMLNATRRPTELVIDEGWTWLDSPTGSAMLEILGRLGRSLKLGCTVITQQVREFLIYRDGTPNMAGRTFLKNTETVVLLRQLRPSREDADATDDPIAMARQQFGLRPGEVQWLNQCQRDPAGNGATGLLLKGREAIPLHIPRASEPLHTWITQGSRGALAGRTLHTEEVADGTSA